MANPCPCTSPSPSNSACNNPLHFAISFPSHGVCSRCLRKLPFGSPWTSSVGLLSSFPSTADSERVVDQGPLPRTELRCPTPAILGLAQRHVFHAARLIHLRGIC